MLDATAGLRQTPSGIRKRPPREHDAPPARGLAPPTQPLRRSTGVTEWSSKSRPGGQPRPTAASSAVPSGPEHAYHSQLRAAVSASAAPHGYTLALWTATAVTSSERGAPGTAEVLALLTGATL